MSLEGLRAEFEARGGELGPLVYAEIRKRAEEIVRGYDPKIYGNVQRWSEGIDDLVQDVVINRLLREGQLDAAFLLANDLEHFRNLLGRQLKRELARRRRRTIIDNLLDRAKTVLREPPFEETRLRGRFARAGAKLPDRDPTPSEIREAADKIRSVPRIRPGQGGRASPGYSTEGLVRALTGVASALPCSFSLRDLDQVFAEVFTDWLPGFLVDLEEESITDASPSPDQAILARAKAQEVFRALSVDQRELYFRKIVDGATDESLADWYGVSRQTIHNRKRKLLSTLEDHLDIDEGERRSVIAALTELVVRARGEADA